MDLLLTTVITQSTYNSVNADLLVSTSNNWAILRFVVQVHSFSYQQDVGFFFEYSLF